MNSGARTATNPRTKSLYRDLHEEHSHDEGGTEPGAPLAEVPTGAALAERAVRGGAGQHEEHSRVPDGDEGEDVVEGGREPGGLTQKASLLKMRVTWNGNRSSTASTRRQSM